MNLRAPKASTAAASSARPTATVVIAAHQAATTLASCLEAVLQQEPPPDEVLVVDDGSTDDTAHVLQSFGSQIRVITQENRGEAAAKNAGLRAARCDVVVLVDADDRLLPRWLATVMDVLMSRPDLDLVTTDAWLVTDGRRVRRAYERGMWFPVELQREEMLIRNFVVGFVAVRREAILTSGGFDERIAVASDWSAWARLVLSGGVIGMVPVPLAEYHVQTGSLSANKVRLVQGRVDVVRHLMDEPACTSRDLEILAGTLRRQSALLQDLQARAAIRARDGSAAQRARAIARSGNYPLSTRIKYCVAGCLPVAVTSWLYHRISRAPRYGGFRDAR